MEKEDHIGRRDFMAFTLGAVTASITDAGGSVLAELISEPQMNDYPGLPVREHEPVFVWLRDQVPEALWPALMRKPEVLRLSPTHRSRLG
jgi:hypothetical protein